jgi:hypothetical protein
VKLLHFKGISIIPKGVIFSWKFWRLLLEKSESKGMLLSSRNICSLVLFLEDQLQRQVEAPDA